MYSIVTYSMGNYRDTKTVKEYATLRAARCAYTKLVTQKMNSLQYQTMIDMDKYFVQFIPDDHSSDTFNDEIYVIIKQP